MNVVDLQMWAIRQAAVRRRMRDRPSDAVLNALLKHLDAGPVQYEYTNTRTGETMILPSHEWQLTKVIHV